MKTPSSLFLIIALVISGCAAKPVLIPTPSQVAPTPTFLVQQPTATVPAPIPATNTATPEIEVLTATATTEPTATTAGLTMEIVGDTGQSPVPQPQSCQRSMNWVAYTVQRSDTLASLAQRTGASWQQIQSANCLPGTTIFSGQILLLPFIPAPIPQPASLGPSNPIATIETFPAVNPGDPNLAVTPEKGPPGTLFIFTLDTFLPGETVNFIIKTTRGREVYRTTVQMSSLGNALVTYQSPATAEVRTYIAEALGGKSDSASFTITASYP